MASSEWRTGDRATIHSLLAIRHSLSAATLIRGNLHGLASRAHDLCRLVVDGRPAHLGGAARAHARRPHPVAGGEPAGRLPARARSVLLRQPAPALSGADA